MRNENEKAIEVFNKAIEINPEVALPYYKLSIFYRKENELEKAEEYKKIALEKGVLQKFIDREEGITASKVATIDQIPEATAESSQ